MNAVRPIRDDEKLQDLIKALDMVHSKYGLLARIGSYTGLRVSDVLGIRVRDACAKMAVLERKTGKVKNVELSAELLIVIARHVMRHGLKPNDYLIFSRPERKDKPLSRTQAHRVIRSVSRLTGLKNVSSHSLRKTYALRLYRRTRDLEAVRVALNHLHVSTTLRYLLDAESLEKLLL